MIPIGTTVRVTRGSHYGVVGTLAYRDRHGVLLLVEAPPHGESCYYGASHRGIERA